MKYFDMEQEIDKHPPVTISYYFRSLIIEKVG